MYEDEDNKHRLSRYTRMENFKSYTYTRFPHEELFGLIYDNILVNHLFR